MRSSCLTFCRWALERLGASVEATEAFLFSIAGGPWNPEFELVEHIRPDDSDENKRAVARSWFLQIAKPFVSQVKKWGSKAPFRDGLGSV